MKDDLTRTIQQRKVNRRALSNLRKFSEGDIITKRCTFSLAGATAVAHLVPIVAITTDTARSNSTEFPSFAARYQEFRVKSMKMFFIPVANVATVDGGVSNIPTLLVADYLSTNTPSTPAQLLSDERVAIHHGCQMFSFTTDWSRNPNAKLWSSTSVAIPNPNLYSIVYGSIVADPLVANVIYFNNIIEYIVEFRGSQ